MRQQHLFAIAACLCSAAVVLVSAVPLPADNQELDVLQIPLSDGKELDVLTLGAKDQEQIIAERNKRTIGLLRELFPDITKQIDDIVNRIIGQVIRVAGPSLLPALLGNNRPTTERSDFDADFEDDDDTSNDVNVPSNSVSTTAANSQQNGGTRVSIVLPTFPPDSGSSTPTPTAASDNVSLEQATTGVAASTATTTAVEIATTVTTTPATTTTTVATTSPQTTTELTTTTSRPVETPVTFPVTTTASATSPIIIPTPIPTILSPTTLPTTTVNSILVIPRAKSKSNNIPTDINSSTTNPTTESTESTFDTVTTPTPPALPETAPPRQYPTDSPSISDILNTPTRINTIAGETLPPPTIPATYIGRFEGDVTSPAISQQPSSSNALPLAVDVDRSQLVALIDNINRLLNSPNILITNSNNLNTPQFTTTTKTITTTPLKVVSTQSSALNSSAKNGATDTQIDLSAINKQLEETIRVARQVKEAEAAAQAIAQQQQQQTPSSLPAQLPIPSKTDPNAPIQLSFNNEARDSSKPVNNDLRLTESKSPAIDELTLDSNEDAADLDDRNKRFLSFGGAGVAGGSGGNTGNAAPGAGSGNFLFDIIRLFSGSVQTQAGDEAANGANSVSGGGDSDGDSDANRAADGYTEGIPGPVTRLVVLANRGLANLIQDLILRVAATSEKFVNFKAKLITALI